jgi:ribonucleoside-diphosphate reductase alpha chain
MNVASEAVGEVEQGGSRRGAAMFMLDDWHPDVLQFIEAKKEKGKIVNANISVSVSDELMGRVESGGLWTFQFPDTTDPRYDLEWDGDLAGWKSRGGRVKDYSCLP